MIKRFRHKGLEALFRTGSDAFSCGLNDGPLPEAMAFIGCILKGDRQRGQSGCPAIIASPSKIEDEDGVNVDLEDYH
jgi:hypothetical protein